MLKLRPRQLFIIFLVLASVSPADSPPEPSDAELQRILQMRAANEKNAARIVDDYAKTVESLIGEAAQPEVLDNRLYMDTPLRYHCRKQMAIQTLGKLRAVAAVPVLIENLEYRIDPGQYIQFVDEELLDYPAVGALLSIGIPSADPAIRVIASYDVKTRKGKNALYVIKSVLGNDLARRRLLDASSNTTSPAMKANLLEASNQIPDGDGSR